jgi:hypothetical protein
MLGEESVEGRDKECHGDCHQGAMLALVDVVIMVQNDESLNLGHRNDTSNDTSSLPTQDAQTAHRKWGSGLLHVARCKF